MSVRLPDQRHLLLLAGAGGVSVDHVLPSARTVTPHLSVVFLSPHADPAPAARAAWARDFLGEWIVVDDGVAMSETVLAIHGRNAIDGIATFSELFVPMQAELQEKLGLHGNPVDAAHAAHSKLLQRQRMAAAGLPGVRFAAVRDDADVDEAALAVGFPAVLKPAHGAASFQVTAVGSPDELWSAWRRGRSAMARSPLLTRDGTFVLESLLEGADWYGVARYGDYCSVESLIQHGEVHHLAILDKMPLAPGFVEQGDFAPSRLDRRGQGAVLDHATAVIRAVGLTDGAAHTEIKLTPDGPRCIEINARLGGATAHLLNHASDHDVVASVLRIALGQPIDPSIRFHHQVCFRSIAAPRRRVRILSAPTLDQVRVAHPSVRYCNTRFRPGMVLEADSSALLVTFVVAGDDHEECVARVRDVERGLAFGFDDERTRVLFVDRVGYHRYRRPDGSPPLDPERYRVTLLTGPGLAGSARQDECAEVISLDLADAALLDRTIRELHAQIGFDQIMVFTERLLQPIAALREELGIDGPRTADIARFRDKAIMKETAAAAGLPVPAWMAITRPADAAPLLEAHGRIILKPRGGTGSTGLFDASSPADLARIDARDDVDFSNYLAEQYVDADMIHIDGVVYDGRLLVCSVSRYLQSTRTYSAGGAYLASIMLDADDPVAVAAGAFTRSVVDAFSVCHAVLHLECFARPDGDLVFCEVACRAGGGGIVKTVEATHGINLFEAMVDVALSRRPELSRTRLTPSAGFVLFYPRRGIFAGVHDEAVPAHWVIDRRVNAKLGDRLDDAWIAGGALATYVIGGSGSAEVARRIADLVRAVRIDIDH